MLFKLPLPVSLLLVNHLLSVPILEELAQIVAGYPTLGNTTRLEEAAGQTFFACFLTASLYASPFFDRLVFRKFTWRGLISPKAIYSKGASGAIMAIAAYSVLKCPRKLSKHEFYTLVDIRIPALILVFSVCIAGFIPSSRRPRGKRKLCQSWCAFWRLRVCS